MNKILLTIICLVLVSSYSYSHEVSTDKCYTDPNGICYEPDSKKPFTGIYTHYYESGQLERRGNLENGKEEGVGDSLSEGFKNGMWWKALIFSILTFFGIIVGFLLLILPGLYLSTAWILGFYLLVDKGMLPLEALGKSRELVHQLGFWKIFVIVIGLGIATQLIAVIPFLGLLLIFLMPFIIMIYVAIYENAIGNPLAVTKEK